MLTDLGHCTSTSHESRTILAANNTVIAPSYVDMDIRVRLCFETVARALQLYLYTKGHTLQIL